MVAPSALLQLADSELAALGVAALRANKATWPAPSIQGVKTLLFSTVRLQEVDQTEPLLELDFVTSHKLPLARMLLMLVKYTALCGLGIVVIRKTEVKLAPTPEVKGRGNK